MNLLQILAIFLLNVFSYQGNFSSPTQHGFDEWLQTQAEASNSMPNCGCFPVDHASPGPRPPSGYSKITPHGDQCVVGGGHPSDWCYPCTDYYYPNASDLRGVSSLHDYHSGANTTSGRVAGNDAEFIVDRFDSTYTCAHPRSCG